MTRIVVYRDDYQNSKKKYAELCRIYILKNNVETVEEIKNWSHDKLINIAHKNHQTNILKRTEPIKINKPCKNFCEGWYINDTKCACGQRCIMLKNVNLEYLNFTILDAKPSGSIMCF